MQRLSDTGLERLKNRLEADREKLWEKHGGFIPLPPEKPRCSTCNGAGAYLRRRAGDTGSSEDDMVTCPDCFGQGIKDKDKIIKDRRAASGMDHKSDMTFAATKPYPWQHEVFTAGRQYADSPRQWLWLTGGVNVGKSHLAFCVGNACLDAGIATVFHDVPKLLDNLRRGYKKDAEVDFDAQMDRLFHVHVLILDDYGKHQSTDWAGDKLYQVTNHRLERGMPTVLTTNLTMDEMDQQSNRLFQHVLQDPDVLVVNFPDERPQ